MSHLKTTMPHDTNSKKCSKKLTHDIVLQLHDAVGYPVDGTKFTVKLAIRVKGEKIKISFPAINFEVGPQSVQNAILPPITVGPGFLRTVEGFLPESLCPNNVLYESYLVASNTGLSQPFTWYTPSRIAGITQQPTPVSGYILSITFFGGIIIQGAGTYKNLIPAGAQTLLPTNVFYYHHPPEIICKNLKLSVAPSNFTEWPGGTYTALGSSIRDSHVNDAFNNIVAWTWVDNSNQVDKTNQVSNVMVAIGTVEDGKLVVRPPIQLSSNPQPSGTYVFDTAVAINRSNPKNIVVSWGNNNTPTTPYRAVSFDGGLTWPINGPTNLQPPGYYPPGVIALAADNRGVSSDKYGNIWYSTTQTGDENGNYLDQPLFWVSPDGGVTYLEAYRVPFPPNFNLNWDYFDYPQFTFGEDGNGNYGMWFVADYFLGYHTCTYWDCVPCVGFLPITGKMQVGGPVPLGSIPASTPSFLYDLVNTQTVPNLAASSDGRVWCQSYVNCPSNFVATVFGPMVVRYKSPPNATYPDPVTSNYSGPWQLNYMNIAQGQSEIIGGATLANNISFPVVGYFNSVTTIIWDEKRQALYSLLQQQAPDNVGFDYPLKTSQNMRLYLQISRNNGQSWSQPIYISSTSFANRGFQSMALDPITGNLIFGWYDGRNDQTYHSLDYYAALIKSEDLDKYVDKIPQSNPTYVTPPSTGSITIIPPTCH
jgi:hypothetical protein